MLKVGDHWFWIGIKQLHGNGFYGRLRTKTGPRSWEFAHRLSYELANGPIPDGMLGLHKCRHTLCVNPDHIRIGTHLENHQDRERDGMTARGERQGSSKLREHQVRRILQMKGKVRQADLARKYGVSQSTISIIHQGIGWSHVHAATATAR